jgi:DNA-directed RNA polymerase subunit RPC12/RpoP
MTRLGKIRLLNRIDRENKIFNSQHQIVFLCSNCGFRVVVTDRENPYIACQVGNYYEYDLDPNEYGRYIKKEDENINGTFWSRPASYICLNCGNTLDENIEICDVCGSNNIIFWKYIPGKKCPSCNGIFNKGIIFNTHEEYSDYNLNMWIEGIEKAKIKYGINKTNIIKNISEEEKIKRQELTETIRIYMDQRYIINRNNNIIKFSCHRSFYPFFDIIVEWNTEDEIGNLIFCSLTFDENEVSFKKIDIEYNKIGTLLSILNKYKYFTKPNKIKRMGLDGSRWTLEVQYNNQYKEINIWTPKDGVIYEIGIKLIEYSGVVIKELY